MPPQRRCFAASSARLLWWHAMWCRPPYWWSRTPQVTVFTGKMSGWNPGFSMVFFTRNMVPRGPARVPYQFWNHPIFKPKYDSSKIHQCHGCFRQHCWKQNITWVDVEEFLQTTPSIWVCLKVPLKSHGWWSCSPLNGHKSGGKFHHSETNACALA